MLAKQPTMIAILLMLAGTLAVGEVNRPVEVRMRAQDAVPVLINGRFGSGEWDETGAPEVEDRLLLILNQDRHYLYLGIRFLREMHTGIDLYLAGSSGTPRKLHVSSALGEAEFAAGVWGDIQWGKNALWSANSIGLISENGAQKVVPLEGFEFQISKSLIAGPSWRLFLQLKRPDMKFPKDANPDSTSTWLAIAMVRP
ncbi:MAG: hypothetical protein AB1714_12240 [Acidobacteriota bacterium]